MRPAAGPGSVSVARPLDVYRSLGLLVGTADFPAVGRFASFAGPADSTLVFFSMSLPTSALRFARDAAGGFAAEYRVALTAMRGGQRVRRLERTEIVRVAERRETTRTDEAVFFQAFLALEPGEYELQLRVQDVNSPRGMESVDSVRLPAYGAGGVQFSAPVVVNEASGRPSQSALPQLLANPRVTVPYGDEPLLVYLEGYGVPAGPGGLLQVRDGDGQEVARADVTFTGAAPDVRTTVVGVPVDALPIGHLEIAFVPEGAAVPAAGSPLLVTLSDTWIIADFGEVLDYMSHIAEPEELDSLRAASGRERARLWDAFWAARDPDPTTLRNEYRDGYFERVQEANVRLREPGVPGWRTERGMVFIVLGAPVAVQEYPGDVAGQPRLIVWIYQDAVLGRVELRFVDESGFGRYRLTPASRSDFGTLADRIRRGHSAGPAPARSASTRPPSL